MAINRIVDSLKESLVDIQNIIQQQFNQDNNLLQAGFVILEFRHTNMLFATEFTSNNNDKYKVAIDFGQEEGVLRNITCQLNLTPEEFSL